MAGPCYLIKLSPHYISHKYHGIMQGPPAEVNNAYTNTFVNCVSLLKGNRTVIVGVGGFIYVYKRLRLQYSLINVFICCLGCFGVFVHESFIYMKCKH